MRLDIVASLTFGFLRLCKTAMPLSAEVVIFLFGAQLPPHSPVWKMFSVIFFPLRQYLFPEGNLSLNRIFLPAEASKGVVAAFAAAPAAADVPVTPNVAPVMAAPIVDCQQEAADQVAEDGWSSS